MSNTQLYSSNADGVIYAAPAAPAFTVKFRTTKKGKILDGLKTDNVKTEIIVNDKNTVTKDNATADDLVSIRVSVSGSVLSHARLQEILKGIAAQLPLWADENVILGFAPTSVPTKY